MHATSSIIDPLIFLICVNDISKTFSLPHSVMFADTIVFVTDKSADMLMSKINVEVRMVATWFRANKPSLNLTKTTFILFHSRRKTIPIYNLNITIDNQT